MPSVIARGLAWLAGLDGLAGVAVAAGEPVMARVAGCFWAAGRMAAGDALVVLDSLAHGCYELLHVGCVHAHQLLLYLSI